ncbi:vacuole protein [Moesziomyces aphidis]|uniref:Vacuole protein n=1 Tax=Moesziomyces aphidis TaxID=84754 RepID=W3VR57_MOEAP|nr:vacuole protein [Moesziomyces aphidis]
MRASSRQQRMHNVHTRGVRGILPIRSGRATLRASAGATRGCPASNRLGRRNHSKSKSAPQTHRSTTLSHERTLLIGPTKPPRTVPPAPPQHAITKALAPPNITPFPSHASIEFQHQVFGAPGSLDPPVSVDRHHRLPASVVTFCQDKSAASQPQTGSLAIMSSGAGGGPEAVDEASSLLPANHSSQPRRESFSIGRLINPFRGSAGSAGSAGAQRATDPQQYQYDARRPSNAWTPTSPNAPQNAQRRRNNNNNNKFPRSVTFDSPHSSFPPGPKQDRSRVTSYHPPSNNRSHGMDDDNDSGYDIERQGSGWNRRSVNSSAFSHLEGRSYRFQPSQDTASLATSLVPGSYTATSSSIRDETAQLAGMIMSDDEAQGSTSDSHMSHIYDIGEGDEEPSPPAQLFPPRAKDAADFSPTTSPIASLGVQAGPSNLTRAMAASHQTSPQSAKSSLRSEDDGSQATPRVTSFLGLSQPVATPQNLAEEDELEDKSLGAGLAAASPANESRPLSRSRSRSSARRTSRSHPASADRSVSRDRQESETGQSSFSQFSTSEQQQRAGIGYGALAQAEQSVFEAEHGIPRQPRRASHHPPEPQKTLNPFWTMVPKGWRPGEGEYPIRSLNPAQHVHDFIQSVRGITWKSAAEASVEPIRLIPAVILGMLMNVLDGVSYGMIMFPAAYPIFANFGGDGVSMFFVTCILSQLVYTLGGSIFKGGNGSMMIEVVPFFHILVRIIIEELGDENPQAVIATTMVAFALSSVLTGLAFLLLGALRLGVLIGFFPRHILVGCIGGVGIFLIETGLEVCSRLQSEDGFQYNLDTLRYFFQSGHMVALWLPPLLLAVLLRVITSRFHHPLIFPGYFLMIPVVFYVVASGFLGIPIQHLRDDGWVFDIGESASKAAFYRFYTYFDFGQTSWRALWATMPTQLAMVFFGILHVPLNVPALGVSINEDNVETDRELVAHGISNMLAGLIGVVPNYLCYVNSVLFYRVGGGSRLSGLMLAGGTAIIMIAGPGTISYLPIMIVGALIFVLGIDLAKEALYDTVGRVNGWEYLTIWVIVIVMTYWDFVIGILAGIIIACCFFVVQTSRRKTVRAILDGSVARSTVRRHMTQRHFLDEVGTQTQIIKLQGFLFFGTINSVENLIRRALDIAAWNQNPIRFLIVDYTLVSGVDFSAAEAFLRINRLLMAKGVLLVFCGLNPDSDVGVALRSVDLWADRSENLEVFANLNEALEWTENEYLRGMYASSLMAAKAFGKASLAAEGGLTVPDQKRKPAFVLDHSVENSPRRHHLHEAAKTAVRSERTTPISEIVPTLPTEAKEGDSAIPAVKAAAGQPLPLLGITFRAYLQGPTGVAEEEFFTQLVPYFVQVRKGKGEVLWSRGDVADGMYLIEKGIVKARYDFPQEQYEINEAMLAGTIAGELTFLSRKERNTTAYADTDCTLWMIDQDKLEAMHSERPQVYQRFVEVLLRVAGDEQESIMSYLVSRLS